jgi:NifU-like protein involved in Fe-S cluster formation
MYSQTINEHIANPRNVGELENPSGRGDAVNEACMDRLLLTIRIDAGRISEAKVKAQGCPPTIAAASVLSELIIGRSLAEAETLTRRNVETALEHLPAMKKHCAALAIDALQMAIADSRSLR